MRLTLTTLSTLAVLALGMSGTATAQPADSRTYFTFSAPVTLPGVTLPAGRYLFRLADPNTSRKVVNVLSEDGTKSLAMLHTIPNQLLTAPNEAEIRFMETSANMPPPIKTWWYPGRATGYEFIYPKQQAAQIAKSTSEPVLTTRTETTDLATADLARVTGSGSAAPVTVEANPAPVAAATGRAQRGEVASGSPAPVAQEARADDRAVRPARTRLPQTASAMPSVVLFGSLALLAGLGLSLWRRSQV